ncbi:MAG TPA: hypothetical protein VKT77_01785 [Chthonomonadaceae bacterium]|nr:hypothetical protein [Chthonomonadaceae bacterium]
MVRRNITLLASALLLGLVISSTPANADPVHFRFRGGSWSHSRHAGWHRYWGGPSIGFYYAPSPVYVVPGYDDPYYYSGPDYWTSDPSFGINLNLGGGHGHIRYRSGHRYHHHRY